MFMPVDNVLIKKGKKQGLEKGRKKLFDFI